jgi:glycosyltransferase involved in cell wall biosynthesis
MKILQVNKFLYPKGGAEIVCLGLSEQLADAGHEVFHFGMADARNTVGEDADCFPREVDYHGDRSLGQKVGEGLRTIYGREAKRGMAKLLDRRRPDIIHAHNIYHQLTPSILEPARERGIPVMLTLHDYKLVCPVYTLLRDGSVCEKCIRGPEPIISHRCKGGSLAESLVLWAEDRLHRTLGSYEKGVSLFTSPSQFLRQKVIEGRLSAESIVHLPNALPFPQETLDMPYRSPSAGRPELLWVGRMSYEKGLATLLKALALSEGDLKLLLAGDGPEEASLRTLAEKLRLGDRVEFLGRVPRDEVRDLILRTHGTVLPSEWFENAPLSLLESLALGRAVIGSEMGGIPEMLENEKTGWLFPAGNVDALAALLSRWASLGEARETAGRAAFEFARERHHPEQVLETTLDLYRKLLGK